jgi:hypothetical protein
MPYNFAEVFANSAPATADDFPVAYTTIVITQEDGRTAFGEDWFYINHANRTISRGINNADPAFDFYLIFSDRQRFRGNADQLGVEITDVDPNVCRARFILKSWGSPQYSVDYIVAVGRLYTGSGTSIGNAPTLALYSLAFSTLDRQQVVLL